MKEIIYKNNPETGENELIEEKENLPSLSDFKTLLLLKVDEQTQDNIFAGFTFGNILFSMSMSAQTNWTNLPLIPESGYPISIMGKDNQSEYSLSFTNRLNFYGSALAHKNGCLQAGNAKKKQVNNCTTVEQLKTLADGWGFSY